MENGHEAFGSGDLVALHHEGRTSLARTIRRAESRLGARRPNLATRADVWALVRALEASRGEEVAQ